MTVRPPADITPDVFFTTWLPAQLAAAPTRELQPLIVRVSLTGDDGGAWDLATGPAGVTIGRAGADPADVSLTHTVADWRAVIFGEPGAPALVPERAGTADLGMLDRVLDRATQQLLASAPGALRFEVTGYNGRTWSLDVKIGKGPAPAEPDATISVDAETYAQIVARTLPAPAAFFSGKLKITGNVNLAMQMGMALMQRR